MSGDRVLAGRYRLDREIGRGGMGQVWSALDTRLQRQVAVKMVELGGGDDVAAERFQQEAHATAALSHPNIVTIFDNGVDGSTAYLVMELLSGPSLERLVHDQGPLPVDTALEYAQAVASALGAAHRAGIVHRDVKPSNLMLDQRGDLRMVDFGIARLDQERTSRLTATSTVIGSAPYLSPEQATGSTATAQSDLYSLGCVLMALLTGEPPFDGEHPLSILHHHLSTPPPRPSDRRHGIPPAVDDLVAQLLAKDPRDRPASAADVAARIASIRRGSAPATTMLPAAGAAAATTVLPAAPAHQTRPRPAAYVREEREPAYVPPRREEPRRRGLGALWFLVLLLAAAVAAMAFLVLRPKGTTPTPGPTTTVTRTQTPTATSPSSEAPSPSPSSSSPTPTPTESSTTPTPTETPTPTSTPTESSTTTTPTETSAAPTTDPTWTTSASTAASALQSTVDGSGLPEDVAKDAGKSLKALDKAIRKEDPASARDALAALGGAVQEGVDTGAVDPTAQSSIQSAADQVAATLPAA